MGRMTIRISDELEKKVRAKAKERFGEGEDNLSKAFEAAFNEYMEDFEEEKRRKVLSDYKERKISLQRAAELLGIHLVEMLELIQREGLYLDYTEEELREDLKGLTR